MLKKRSDFTNKIRREPSGEKKIVIWNEGNYQALSRKRFTKDY